MPDHSFVARFGSVIVSRGVAAVPQALFTCESDLGLTPQQVWFASYILSVPWSPPFPYPSLLKMAARTGYSKMQLHEIKNSLVTCGLLRLVTRTKQDGGQTPTGTTSLLYSRYCASDYRAIQVDPTAPETSSHFPRQQKKPRTTPSL